MAELAEELYKFNPWWEGNFKNRFLPRPKYQHFLAAQRHTRDIVVITGLRRVGKTSLMKLCIADLLQAADGAGG